MADIMADKARQKEIQKEAGMSTYVNDAMRLKNVVDTGVKDEGKFSLTPKQVSDLLGIFERQKANLQKKVNEIQGTQSMGALSSQQAKTQGTKLSSEKAKKKQIKDTDIKKALRKNKGGSVTKNRKGANDYRSGGYVLSTVDKRKVKRNGK
jgi:hypothetical protein